MSGVCEWLMSTAISDWSVCCIRRAVRFVIRPITRWWSRGWRIGIGSMAGRSLGFDDSERYARRERAGVWGQQGSVKPWDHRRAKRAEQKQRREAAESPWVILIGGVFKLVGAIFVAMLKASASSGGRRRRRDGGVGGGEARPGGGPPHSLRDSSPGGGALFLLAGDGAAFGSGYEGGVFGEDSVGVVGGWGSPVGSTAV